MSAFFGNQASDAQLVAQSLAGSREAFGAIVSRYQGLVCALAYSTTGSLSQSEDLAQETFLTAWKQLARLREPAKLRSWLCTIARNLAYRACQQLGHEPVHAAQPLELVCEVPAVGPHPLEQTISKEEQALLWHAIERIPLAYREPLVLFYRKHESVEEVAQSLELSEETVRQRLARGRKLLRVEVLKFVEGALEKTEPGAEFTVGVLGLLPLLPASVKTAGIGALASKVGAAAKLVIMTSVTKTIIITAVVTAAIVVPVTVALHHPAAGPDRGVWAQRGRGARTLTPQQAAAAKQTAQGFFEALEKADWAAVQNYYPSYAPAGRKFQDVFTDQLKEYLGGIHVVSLGEPYTDASYGGVFVPYEIRFKDGSPKKFRLAVRNDNPEKRWYWDGGL